MNDALPPLLPSRPRGPSSRRSLPRLRQQLLCRIHRRYGTVSEELAVGPLRLSFTRIADADAVLQESAAAEAREASARQPGDDLHLPYWAEVWASALGMGCYFARQWSHLCPADEEGAIAARACAVLREARPARVLDLGCGMGLAGVVAARLGAAVTFADLEPPALLFARLNSLADAARCRYRQLNWRKDRLPGVFDLILGADILYDRLQWEAQEGFFRHHLAPGGAVVLGEPGRVTGDDYPLWITQRGWNLRQRAEIMPTGKRIRIFELEPGR